jgi:N-acetylglucosaminyldiphosphoundecaprenol N-acetyl-beta-D-mannosaminyltransferase
MRERANILGVRVDRISAEELHVQTLRLAQSGENAMILYANPHCLNLSYHRPWLRNLLNSADIVFCDGFGLLLAAKILGKLSLERVTYGAEIWRLLELAELHNLSIYFLGARPGVAGKAAARLKEKYTSLNIVGFWHGYFDRTPGSPENEAVVQGINASNPDILLVGFGMPLQELWLKENRERLSVNVAITVGATIDFFAGEGRGSLRAPPILADNGFEWLTRLLLEPRRLWRRYIIGNPLFLLRVLRQHLSESKEKTQEQ